MSPTVSALVTVYHRITPTDLTWALTSLKHQTEPAEQTVIAADGPIPTELQQVIDDFIATYPYRAQLVSLDKNQGSAIASNAGLAVCTEEFIARLDADDIAAPTRFEKQREFLRSHPNIDVLGTAIAEFKEEELAWHRTADMGALEKLHTTTRALPTTHKQIRRYAKINSPINHPSSMIRRTAITEAGGYHQVHHMEDYDLWARLIARGYTLHNMPETLTYFRLSPSTFDRRTGPEMFRAEQVMQATLRQCGIISAPRSIVNIVVRSAYRALPKPALQKVYQILFQRNDMRKNRR